MYNSVLLSIFTRLYKSPLSISRNFSSSQTETLFPLNNISSFPLLPQPMLTSILLSVSMNLPILERQWVDVFELKCWRRLVRVPWTARRFNQSILEEISLDYSLERLMLKLKLQYFGHLMGRTDWLGKIDRRQEEKEATEDETVGWHHWLDGHEFEQTLRVGDGQGSLAHCSPRSRKESDTTELNWGTSYKWNHTYLPFCVWLVFS